MSVCIYTHQDRGLALELRVVWVLMERALISIPPGIWLLETLKLVIKFSFFCLAKLLIF